MKNNLQSLSSFIWSVADILRGDFRPSQYGRIILPFTILRRLEIVLDSRKDKVVAKAKSLGRMKEDAREKILKKEAGEAFYNTSKLTLSTISTKDPLSDIESYINSFSADVREIFTNFNFSEFLSKLDEADLLYLVVQKFVDKKLDLSPKTVSNYDMGLVFEDLIRRFAEAANDDAGDHFTPRDMVRLATSLVFLEDDEVLSKKGVVRHIYDPTCGTGGFLSSGMEYLHELNGDAQLVGFGQELNEESYAICKADMLIKGQDVSNIKRGNTLSNDQLSDNKFDYILSNPPFGVDWKKAEKEVRKEYKDKGYNGRFGPGLPRINDGAMLFLLHVIDKMRDPSDGHASRCGVVLSGSPLFTGGAGSGESEIRRYLFENDLVESIVALPSDMFFNTGITTYIWIITNKKPKERIGKVQLIDASRHFTKMKKSLGAKRNILSDDQIEDIVKLFGENKKKRVKKNNKVILESKIFPNSKFGYRKVTIERPLKLAVYPNNSEKMTRLLKDKNFLKIKEGERDLVVTALGSLENTYLSRDKFLKDFKESLNEKVSLSSSQVKMILKHMSEHDDQAEVCMKGKNIEANPDLRDYEEIPLDENIEEYFQREVIPFAGDAWIDYKKVDSADEKVGLIGYEVSFNQYFYEYEEPDPLEEIDEKLNDSINKIQTLLAEVRS